MLCCNWTAILSRAFLKSNRNKTSDDAQTREVLNKNNQQIYFQQTFYLISYDNAADLITTEERNLRISFHSVTTAFKYFSYFKLCVHIWFNLAPRVSAEG